MKEISDDSFLLVKTLTFIHFTLKFKIQTKEVP